MDLQEFMVIILSNLLKKKKIIDDLPGFVLFMENIGVSPFTSFSIPAIFSGKSFDANISPETYFKESIKNGFQNTLFNLGYTVNLIPEVDMQNSKYTNYYRSPHVYGLTLDEIVEKDAKHLIDVTLFKTLPHFVRKKLYNNFLNEY